jgi:N-acyl-D-amino-acid deacylase
LYDLLIKNGTVIDGTGGCRRHLDVAVLEGVIAKVESDICEKALNTIDAAELVVAPGFIDVHTHDDRLLLCSPDMVPKVSQGVTTVVGGNCGVSLAPLKGVDPPPPMNLLGGQEWYRFRSVREYREQLQTAGMAVNCVMLVGHSTLRAGVMNELGRAATEAEINKMKTIMVDALEDGCAGLSTGLAYPTASSASTSEVISLAKELGNRGDLGDIYVSHIRDEGDFLIESVDEALEIGIQADVPVVISHHKSTGAANWGKTRKTLEMISRARKSQTVHFDVYPYIASSTVLLPQFIESADRVKVTWSESFPEMGGKFLHKICEQWDCDLESAVAQ